MRVFFETRGGFCARVRGPRFGINRRSLRETRSLIARRDTIFSRPVWLRLAKLFQLLVTLEYLGLMVEVHGALRAPCVNPCERLNFVLLDTVSY